MEFEALPFLVGPGSTIPPQLLANHCCECGRQLISILYRQLKNYDIRTALDLIDKGMRSLHYRRKHDSGRIQCLLDDPTEELRGKLHLADLVDHHHPALEDGILQGRECHALESCDVDPVLADLDAPGELHVRENCGFSLQRGHAKAFAYPLLTDLAGGEPAGNL